MSFPRLLTLSLAAAVHAAEPDTLAETVVLAERLSSGSDALARWDAETINRFDPRGIDELLATDPSFSLYRRQGSVFAHPTTTGVSLRNTGATAASRTLVLRDGVPQNDPFGGWVNWSRYLPGALESASILPAAESAAWGNLSPAGSIRLNAQPPTEERHQLRLTAGSHRTYGGSMSHALVADDGSLAVGLDVFAHHSDGFQTLAPAQRGPIDRRFEIDYSGADLRLRWQAAPNLVVEPTISFFQERRGNGTPAAGNRTEALDVSLRVTAERGDTSWQALAYYQQRNFESAFSAVNAARDSERVALYQFDVPGRGIGGSLVHRRTVTPDLEITMGADLRLLDGETNEDAGTFRRRRAGGEQGFAGLFTSADWRLGPDTSLDASARLDHWAFGDGDRIEVSPTSGALLRRDVFADRDGVEPSGALTLRHRPHPSLDTSLSAGTSFRAPTLNELYRPFRVRDDVTEANAGLDPERFYSLEAGLEWRPNDCLTLGAGLFHHWIHDAIANVPVTDPAEIAAIFGTLPAGGSGAQRRNVDRARVLGIRTSADWRPSERWDLRLDALWSETEFTESTRQPLLEGKPFPQSPELRVNGTVTVRPSDRVSLFTGLGYAADVRDDALARRRLPSYWTCRIGASWRATARLTLRARVENLFDEDIVTGRASNGLVTLGQPRAFWLSGEYRF